MKSIGKIPVRTDLPKKMNVGPPKCIIADLIAQSGIIEGIITLSGEYPRGTSYFVRQNVRTGDLDQIPKNTSLDPLSYGEPENKPFRQPDFAALTRREVHNQVKIGCIVIVVKKSWKDFDHYPNNDGRGRGQSLRDVPWFIKEIQRYLQIPEENIEVSCYTLTAYRESDDTFVIDGEALLVQVPASKVLPYAGRICHHNFQIYNLLERIYHSNSENEVRRPIWYI